MDRVHSIRNSKYEADFLKIIDCLLDGHGSIDSANMSFELNKYCLLINICEKAVFS